MGELSWLKNIHSGFPSETSSSHCCSCYVEYILNHAASGLFLIRSAPFLFLSVGLLDKLVLKRETRLWSLLWKKSPAKRLITRRDVQWHVRHHRKRLQRQIQRFSLRLFSSDVFSSSFSKFSITLNLFVAWSFLYVSGLFCVSRPHYLIDIFLSWGGGVMSQFYVCATVCRHGDHLFVRVLVVNIAKRKCLKTNLILRPRGELWCPHLHINEKWLCTLETTTAGFIRKHLVRQKHVSSDNFAIYHIVDLH